jgi:hypothetical protein
MPAKLLVAAQDLNIHTKGDVVAVVPEGADFGNRETLPYFVRLTVSDATREQVHHYNNVWNIDFKHTLVSENALGWRYRIEVDPIYISVSDIGKSEMKVRMRDHCVPTNPDSMWYGSSIFSFSSNEMVVDIPKDGPYQTAKGLSGTAYLKLLRDDFSDIFRTKLQIRRYYFDPVDVDAAIAAGGEVTVTAVQALNKMKDRLEE